MSHTYDYSDFTSGLDEAQLKDEINASITSPNCYNVGREDTIIIIHFAGPLSGGQVVVLDDLVTNHIPIPALEIISADEFIVNDFTGKFDVWTVSKTITTSPTTIDGLTWVAGNLGKLDSTGIINATEGIYFYNVSATVDAGLNSFVRLTVFNNGSAIFGSCQTVFGDGSRIFIGNGGYLVGTDNLSFTAEMSTASATVVFIVKVLKMFG